MLAAQPWASSPKPQCPAYIMGDNNNYFIMLVHVSVFESMGVIFVRGKKSLNDLSVTISSAPSVHGNLSKLHHILPSGDPQ